MTQAQTEVLPEHREDHDHDHPGFVADMERARILNRRRALGFLGLASTSALVVACGGGSSGSSSGTSSSGGTATATPTPTATATATPTPTATATSSSCTAYATETNGPYPADGTNTSSGSTSNILTISSFQRSDIRSSIGTGNTAAGTQMTFTITLVDVNNSCAALAGYAIYLWHCNADGDYSLYDLPNENYLRGIQTTDANGQVTFTTIVPGTYNGRFPHIHFEVFSSLTNATTGRSARLISQFALPKDTLAALYAANSTYTGSISALNSASLDSDNVFGDNTTAQKAAMMITMSGSASAGYTASAVVGIAT